MFANAQSAVEFLTPEELAARLKVKVSWVKEQSKRSRTADPLPVTKFGRHNRYAWGSPTLMAWLARRVP